MTSMFSVPAAQPLYNYMGMQGQPAAKTPQPYSAEAKTDKTRLQRAGPQPTILTAPPSTAGDSYSGKALGG